MGDTLIMLRQFNGSYNSDLLFAYPPRGQADLQNAHTKCTGFCQQDIHRCTIHLYFNKSFEIVGVCSTQWESLLWGALTSAFHDPTLQLSHLWPFTLSLRITGFCLGNDKVSKSKKLANALLFFNIWSCTLNEYLLMINNDIFKELKWIFVVRRLGCQIMLDLSSNECHIEPTSSDLAHAKVPLIAQQVSPTGDESPLEGLGRIVCWKQSLIFK